MWRQRGRAAAAPTRMRCRSQGIRSRNLDRLPEASPSPFRAARDRALFEARHREGLASKRWGAQKKMETVRNGSRAAAGQPLHKHVWRVVSFERESQFIAYRCQVCVIERFSPPSGESKEPVSHGAC